MGKCVALLARGSFLDEQVPESTAAWRYAAATRLMLRRFNSRSPCNRVRPALSVPALTGEGPLPMFTAMEIHLPPDLQAKLARLATEQGRDTHALAQEAIERFVEYDEWFLREVEQGVGAANRGELVDHEEVGTLIDRRYPG